MPKKDIANPAEVDAYMATTDHPMKEAMAAVRRIVAEADPRVCERIKWKAPSFFYREDIAAFNPRSREFVHVIWLFPLGLERYAPSSLFEGNHVNRREIKFRDLDDVLAQQSELERVTRDWMRCMDEGK